MAAEDGYFKVACSMYVFAKTILIHDDWMVAMQYMSNYIPCIEFYLELPLML